jgi:hypothetical protein
MSGHAAAPAPAPAGAPGAAPDSAEAAKAAQDTIRDLALQIYVEIAGHSYAGAIREGRPEPKALAALSFKLAEAFLQTHREINFALDEEARKRDSFSFDDVDMGHMMKG